MIEVKETSLEELLDKAIHDARLNQKSQLISITKEINKTDPLRFFDAASTLSMDRMFWASTAESFYIVGVGSTYELESEESTIEQTETRWHELLDEAIIHNPYKVSGTGMVVLGGMSFDSTVRKSTLWHNFSHRSFRLPTFMLTEIDRHYYLTVNINVTADSRLKQLIRWIEQTKSMLLNDNGSLPEGPTIKAQYDIAPDEWKQTVKHATDKISQRRVNKIVLAREKQVTLTEDAAISAVLHNLIQTQPNSYVFAFERYGDCFVGASPERLVKQENEQILSTCLAGTAPRGNTVEEDVRMAHTLLHDEKNRREHDFVVRMIRQSMEIYCRDVQVPDEPVIYPLKNLQHLYTPVTATLKEGYGLLNITEKLHPTPALGGVPREESLAFIRDHERVDRGWYGAPVGWIDSNRNGEFAVAIRSGLIQGRQASLFAGCGVVKDSDPEAEYDETTIKFLPMQTVLGG